MKSFRIITRRVSILLIVNMLAIPLYSADPPGKKVKQAKVSRQSDGPIVETNVKWHKIGTLWQRLTNYGKHGDDAYENRTPSCDWPGGSGNSYLYRGSLWLTAEVDGEYHSSMVEDAEFSPLDSVHVITGEDAVSEEDTYTRYYDVKAPEANDHTPLGLEVTERTYAWSESFRDDFIIYEYTIKNVGIDTDDDGYPDMQRDLNNFYFTFRMDGDVSKLPNWAAESKFSNQDDLGCCNANWDWIDLFPIWQGVDHGLSDADADSSMMFMWDGDNPYYPADNGEDDDTGNPGPDGTLQTPGFLGYRILKTEPASFKVSSFHQNHIYNDPATDKEAYERMMKPEVFEGPVLQAGIPFPYDYRAILSVGPLATLAAGDSVVVTAAIGVGCDPVHGKLESLKELVRIMNVAKTLVDADYQLENLAAPAPGLEVTEHVVEGVGQGVEVIWDNVPEQHGNFQGYRVWKSADKTASGAFDWQPLGLGSYFDTTGSVSWPPPSSGIPGYYRIIDTDVINGFEYQYSVQTVSYDETFGTMESNVLTNLVSISPANPVATDLDNIKVVPNPYIGSAAWNNPIPSDADAWEHRIQFTNLPADASIKIFTLDGDLVDEIVSGEIAKKSTSFVSEGSASVAEWDLITRNDQDAAPGIYIYVVESPSAGTKVGKFVIVR